MRGLGIRSEIDVDVDVDEVEIEVKVGVVYCWLVDSSRIRWSLTVVTASLSYLEC